MKKKIAYISFDKENYISSEHFFAIQKLTLNYKNELGNFYDIDYILNNNLNFNQKAGTINLLSKQTNKLSFLKFVVNYILNNNISYVIVHGINSFIWAAIIGVLSPAKVILQHHAEKTYLRKKSVLMLFTDNWIDGYFFNGKKLALPYIQKKCVSSLEKIYEVTEGSSNFKPILIKQKNSLKQLVFIGRLNENKNLITLLKAVYILKKQSLNFHLSVYYTTNEHEQELKAYCLKNQINDMITFKGAVTQTMIETILNQSDIFVSCSLYEGSGYSLIEALACGVFPVVSRIPAFDFLLDGLIEKEQFNALNEIELAAVLHKVLDLDFNDALTQSIRIHFENKCSNSAIAKQIESSLNQLA